LPTNTFSKVLVDTKDILFGSVYSKKTQWLSKTEAKVTKKTYITLLVESESDLDNNTVFMGGKCSLQK
jgi:hypothetical protein